jgi:alpha-ketoglutaric semialdehyde dehydrogenase
MIFRILIDGDWREAAGTRETFKAVNPATLEPLPGEYPVSGRSDIEAALEAALPAVDRLRTAGPDTVAAFLEAFAAAAEARRDDLIETARLETALPVEPRLKSVEFPRLADQVRQAAEACRDRSWCRAVIDSARNIRSRLGPLGGPVVVFSPNNFPFAFNAVGGSDWATALAAGNPVISKANPAHPGTTRILAEAARDAARRTGLPRGAVQLLYHFEPGDGLGLVAHPAVGAVLRG